VPKHSSRSNKKEAGRTNAGINIGTAIFKCFEEYKIEKLPVLIQHFGPKRGDYKSIICFQRLISSELNTDVQEFLEKDLMRKIITGNASNKPELMLSLGPLRQGTLTGSLRFMRSTLPQ